MRSIGFPELVIIILIAVVLFGGKKLGDLGKGLGEGIKNFRDAFKDDSAKQQAAAKPEGAEEPKKPA